MIITINDLRDLIDGKLNPFLNSSQVISLHDHLGGFDKCGNNDILDVLNSQNKKYKILYDQIIYDDISEGYENLDIKFSIPTNATEYNLLESFTNYNIHPPLKFENFICSFNGTPHVSRQLLVSALYKFGWFNREFCSKVFNVSLGQIDGHFKELLDDEVSKRLCIKFFDTSNDIFMSDIISCDYRRFDHSHNILVLSKRITKSFLHIVSETMATSYHPFVGEKFLYSVVNRGLFIAYAQPLWHMHLEKYYGFKPYTNIFDYTFDTITNPIKRLVKIMEMVSKFSILTTNEWNDLYLMESDTIEYNYNHYFSKSYMKHLKSYEK